MAVTSSRKVDGNFPFKMSAELMEIMKFKAQNPIARPQLDKKNLYLVGPRTAGPGKLHQGAVVAKGSVYGPKGDFYGEHGGNLYRAYDEANYGKGQSVNGPIG